MKGINSDVEYLVFEDKGVVICKIWSEADIEGIDNRMLNKDVYMGIAQYSSDGPFNIDTYKKLAYEKAKYEMIKDMY